MVKVVLLQNIVVVLDLEKAKQVKVQMAHQIHRFWSNSRWKFRTTYYYDWAYVLSEDDGGNFNFISQYSAEAGFSLNEMYYFDAIRFCNQLEYNGFNDWFLPSFAQLRYYENNSDVGIIPTILTS